MVNTEDMVIISVFGFILGIAATLFLAWTFYDGRKHNRMLFALILLVLFSLSIFGLSLHKLGGAQSLGRPMSFKDLKENCEFTLEDYLGGLAIISYEQESKAEVRTIYDFPKILPRGIRFMKQKGKIIYEVPKLNI